MSREIRFRAWHKPSRKMADVGFMLVWENCREKLGTKLISSWDEDVEFMQYTGLKDKNGVEIYEGDIVVYGSDRPLPIIFHEHGVFSFEGKDFALGIYDLRKMEVIGNIYENKELLNDQQ